MVSDSFRQEIHVKDNRKFLRKLFRLETNELARRRKLIKSATANQIYFLIKLLRLFFGTGEIPIRSDQAGRIKRSHKLGTIISNFEDDEGFKRIKTSSVSVQRKVLSEINTYRQILFNIFRKP